MTTNPSQRIAVCGSGVLAAGHAFDARDFLGALASEALTFSFEAITPTDMGSTTAR